MVAPNLQMVWSGSCSSEDQDGRWGTGDTGPSSVKTHLLLNTVCVILCYHAITKPLEQGCFFPSSFYLNDATQTIFSGEIWTQFTCEYWQNFDAVALQINLPSLQNVSLDHRRILMSWTTQPREAFVHFLRSGSNVSCGNSTPDASSKWMDGHLDAINFIIDWRKVLFSNNL